MKLTVFLSLLLVASMAKSQISYPPTSATPSGPAGGNLSGTYPNPTVVKINGTALSGLATGLLKNTTATGVPSIAIAGTDLIGGVGNLTTVGSVPYVSASGTLNQDAGQFFWDATNNRLGIGNAIPGYTLDASGTINASTAYRISGNLLSDASRNMLIASIYDTGLTNQLMTFGGADVTVKNGISLTVGGTSTFYNATATTGSTLAAFRAGIAQSTNPVLTVNNNANTVVFSVSSAGGVLATAGIYNSTSSATGFGFNQYVNGLGLAYGSPISWADNGIGVGSYDIGMIRAGVGLLEINSSTTGTLRDLKRRFDAFAVSTVASATTVALTTGVTHITGTTTIATITAPTNFSIAGGGGCVTLIPDGLFMTNTAGNIAIATVAVVSKALIMCYDNATLKWYPSY